MSDDGSAAEVRTYFVRAKNALVARGDFGPIYADLVLHEADWGLDYGPLEDPLRDTLAALALHAASRPIAESSAWTLHFEDPLANIFATCDSACGTVVGTAFSENVKASGKNLFHAVRAAPRLPQRTSVTEFSGGSVFGAAEAFHAQSEQRSARYFRLAPEDIVMVQAQPDCDEEWLASLDLPAVAELDRELELSLLEKRFVKFACGCTHERMLDVLLPVMRSDPDGLFGEGETVRMRCPRCGARHKITREALEARAASKPA